ncbi:Alpha/beta hydrolase family protein [Butyrivibrio proteoclasticus]|uniref:Alpha/beta hydrolase family protein n=1 Tax=Butyrivibrio proteoclasticus TaxID=43305 RepID=A0A1I5WFF9_9FIRM|nr:alpha/beta hydrolase [Butyrivibrio proteoclasticus]SFQ18367.1 Alpha/beta hydrolase family protein [Butyrivibrio proteoclasticus]
MNKFKKIAKWSILAIITVIIVAAIGFKIYTKGYYKADMDTITAIETRLEGSVNSYSDENGMVFLPETSVPKAVIVFYPGGKVECQAYSGLMYEIASRGYICILPRMPENLAFLRINAVEKITANYMDDVDSVKNLDWYIAGHSLGGVAASLYLEDKTDDYAGIILCASYPNADFSDKDIRLLSIYGAEDKVLKADAYENSKAYWPEDSEEYIIEGGIHSFFGCYGIQDGDGTPKISNTEQISETADMIASWIEG